MMKFPPSFRCLILALLPVFAFAYLRADESENPASIMRSLELQETQFRNASSAKEEAEIAESILSTGEPLLKEIKRPSAARSIRRSLDTGENLAPLQKGFLGFWILRAAAATKANDDAAGTEAAWVLKTLGAGDSEKDFVVKVMNALKIKGWSNTNGPELASVERKDFEEAFRINPKSALAYFWRGNDYRIDGKFRQAIKDLTSAIDLDSPDVRGFRNADAFSGRADSYCALNEYQKSIADYNRAIQLTTSNNEIYLKGRAVAFYFAGEFSAAITDLDKYIDWAGFDENAYNTLAWIRATCREAKFRDGRQAVLLAERVVKAMGRKNPTYLDTLAAAYAEIGRFDDAASTQRETIILFKKRGSSMKEAQTALDQYNRHLPLRR